MAPFLHEDEHGNNDLIFLLTFYESWNIILSVYSSWALETRMCTWIMTADPGLIVWSFSCLMEAFQICARRTSWQMQPHLDNFYFALFFPYYLWFGIVSVGNYCSEQEHPLVGIHSPRQTFAWFSLFFPLIFIYLFDTWGPLVV